MANRWSPSATVYIIMDAGRRESGRGFSSVERPRPETERVVVQSNFEIIFRPFVAIAGNNKNNLIISASSCVRTSLVLFPLRLQLLSNSRTDRAIVFPTRRIAIDR